MKGLKVKPVQDYEHIKNRRNLPRYLYHITRKEHFESIKDLGLIRGFLKGVPGWNKDQDFIWLENAQPRYLRKWVEKQYPDWTWSIVKVDTKYLETDKLYRKLKRGQYTPSYVWYLYKNDIPPEAIR